jgi:hypothetical protein
MSSFCHIPFLKKKKKEAIRPGFYGIVGQGLPGTSQSINETYIGCVRGSHFLFRNISGKITWNHTFPDHRAAYGWVLSKSSGKNRDY